MREGGLAALVAPQVTNDGVIEAKAGRVALGAGDTFTRGSVWRRAGVAGGLCEAARGVGGPGGGHHARKGGTVLLTTAEAGT